MIMLISEGVSSIIEYSKNKNDFKDKKIGFIPSSKLSFKYFEYIANDYSKLEVKECIYIDVFKLSDEEIKDMCESVDVLHLSGGDTIPFMRQLDKVKFEEILEDFLNNDKIIVGMSAGGLVMSSTFSNLFDYDDEEETLPKPYDIPFKILDYAFYPHYYSGLNITFKPAILCPDGGLVIINDEVIDVFYGSEIIY